jgi:hypothetical protein
MKKLVLILVFCVVFSINAQTDDITFLHPIFYQQLSGENGDYFYILRPNSIYYENSETGTTQSVECILLENQEYFIKMLCNDLMDLSHASKINTFSLLKNKTADNGYIISHKVFDKNDSAEYEEILINDGLITIPPYQ